MKIACHLLGWLLILLYFWPVLGSSDAYLIPSTFPDAWEVIWTIWWNKNFLNGTGALYSTPKLFHPEGASLFLHATVEGITLPLTFIFQSLTAQRIYSIACFSAFLLNFSSCFEFFKALSGKNAVALLAALFFCFLPAFIGHLNAGQLNMLFFAPLVWILLGLHQISRSKSISVVSALAIFFGITWLPFLNLYYLYYAALSLLLFLLFMLLCEGRRAFKQCLGIAALCTAALLPASIKLWGVANLALSKTYTPDHSPLIHAADLTAYFIPGENQAWGVFFSALNQTFRVNLGESGAYLGFSMIFLALILFKRSRSVNKLFSGFLLVNAVFFFLLSLGPRVDLLGQARFFSPVYSVLNGVLPFFPSVPARFKNVALFCLVSLVCLGFRNSQNFGQLYRFSICLLCIALFEIVPLALRSSTVGQPSALLLELQQNQKISALHDTAKIPQLAMLRQIVHGKTITNAFLARRPKNTERFYRRNPFLRYLEGDLQMGESGLKEAFLNLNVQALLVDVGEQAKLEYLKQVSFLHEVGRDQMVVLFALN